MPTRVFEFSVDDQGKFSYNPPDDWAYVHTDRLQFTTPSGPFTLQLRRTDASPDGGPVMNPLGADIIHGSPSGSGTWVAAVNQINDGLTAEQRRTIWAANGGFIAKYRYLIGLLKNGIPYADDVQTGTYQC